MGSSFLDTFFLWLLVVGPLGAWVLLFWLTHRSSYSTRHQKELMKHMGKLTNSLDRIAGGTEKKSTK